MDNEDKSKGKIKLDRFKGSGLNSRELEMNKQIQRKIDGASSKASSSSFQKFENELKEKNNYFSRSKITDVNEKDTQEMTNKVNSKFKTNIADEEDSYCQKCPSMKNYCPHKNKKDLIKDKFSYPILSNSAYGWLAPYDNLGDNHNLDSTTKSFFNEGHL